MNSRRLGFGVAFVVSMTLVVGTAVAQLKDVTQIGPTVAGGAINKSFAQEIGAATTEQSHGSSQIAKATTRLNEITHEINSSVEEQASGAIRSERSGACARSSSASSRSRKASDR